ncbi:methionine ABC transporter permease MetI [Sphingobacterium chungjuense]|uniref:methionine ABC transporter permease MetI n=1 Tax=Sphingobacterium chungjuense TaxID=2675553 RepID=UPI00140AA662|nr:methionine ABC transporter permease MetI [Sphingobacterium chungjuense]
MSPEVINLLLAGTGETLVMTFVSCFFGFCLGLPTGVYLFASRKGGMLENRTAHNITSFVVNVSRSIPFIILIVWMIPFTRSIVGTSIGLKAALVPLSIGAAPFIARLIENSLLDLPVGLVETARAMGATQFQIIKKVLLPEALPSIINHATVTLITLVGYSAMGGAVGAGGLGQIGYQYGYIGYDAQIMNAVLILLIFMVILIQYSGDFISKKFDHR